MIPGCKGFYARATFNHDPSTLMAEYCRKNSFRIGAQREPANPSNLDLLTRNRAAAVRRLPARGGIEVVLCQPVSGERVYAASLVSELAYGVGSPGFRALITESEKLARPSHTDIMPDSCGAQRYNESSA